MFFSLFNSKGNFFEYTSVMGWTIQRFPTSVDANLHCGICAGVLCDAVLTPCGHSFCQLCIDTWLKRPMTETCPQCRSSVSNKSIIPIYSIRQLVNELSVFCTFKDRGCTLTTRVEDCEMHQQFCGYAPLRCEKCAEVVNRMGLRRHKEMCFKNGVRHSENSKKDTEYDVRHFEKRISNLEIQLKHAKKKLELCEADNRKLRRELAMAKTDFQRGSAPASNAASNRTIKVSWRQSHGMRFDPEYSYGQTPDSIVNLSLLVAGSLQRKPPGIDSTRIFSCIKRCYEMYARCGTSYEHDVHMLIATSYACNWFTDDQRVTLHCWLQSIARYRKFAAVYIRRFHINSSQI